MEEKFITINTSGDKYYVAYETQHKFKNDTLFLSDYVYETIRLLIIEKSSKEQRQRIDEYQSCMEALDNLEYISHIKSNNETIRQAEILINKVKDYLNE